MKKATTLIALLLSAALLTACSTDANVNNSASSTSSQTTASVEENTQTEQPEQTTTTAATTTTIATTTTATTAETAASTTAATTTAAPETEPAVTTTAPIKTTATPIETDPVEPITPPTEITTAATTATEPEEVQPVETKYVALTFDDGPNTTTTAQVLDMLEKHGVIASFFLIGNNINDASAEVVKRAYDAGHEINNHSKSHPFMNELSVDEIIEEFTYTDDKIFEITGERSKFFRPPYIAVNDDMLKNIDVPFIAGLGCNDWVDTNPADRRAQLIIRQVKDGDIILLHDAEGNSLTVDALDIIIPELKSQGYQFVTVSELFAIKGIEINADDNKIYTNVLQKYMYN